MREKYMKSLTEWKNLVAKNAGDSYSLSTCLAILILIETKAKNKKECHTVLQNEISGLSEEQTEVAIGWYLEYTVRGLPSEDMARFRKHNKE